MVNVSRNKRERVSRAKGEHTRELILEAASEIIRNEGLHACTQRAVAAELDISPGTVTWHFRMLDDLHDAVVRNAIDNFKSQTLNWFRECTSDAPEVQLTEFLFWTLQQHTRLLREYELFVAAVSRPRLRESAMQWLRTHSLILQDRFGLISGQADAVVAYTDAWLLRNLLSDGVEKPDRSMTELVFHTLMKSN